MNHVPEVQMSAHLASLRALFLVALHHGVQFPPEAFAVSDESDTVGSLLKVMREVGLTGKVLRGRSWEQVVNFGTAYPALAEYHDGTCVIMVGAMPQAGGDTVLAVLDPRDEKAGAQLMAREKFEQLWTGRVILCKKRFKLLDQGVPFGFRWFLPDIVQQGRYFRDIAVAAIMGSLISFGMPLLFQIMIDKVIPHRSQQTLIAVGVVFLCIFVFDAIFGYVRQYLTVYATNKIDARLASRTFAHMLRLPMTFFESHTSGVLLRHMGQTETIRNFLTGRVFQTFLDTLTVPILLVGLFMYSARLTFVVLAFALVLGGIIAIMVPAFRGYLEQLYAAEGAKQTDLVETIHGMRTVKSLALENLRGKSWDQKVATAIRKRADVGYFLAIAVTIVNSLQSLMSMTLLFIGAFLMFDGTLSMGTLIAFNMLSGRVTGPLVQLAGLINEYQQTELSLRMLGQVMNAKPERDPNQRGVRPMLTGQLEFDNINFQYEGASMKALKDISFTVEEGQTIGIVGRSGSGKTTITRLIQGIHTAQSGLIKLNGTDLRHIDLSHLRRSIGVVLQDNILFRGTIRDNIAAAKPDASLHEVMEAARLAGADEFIDRLPMSYETFVEEGASNFSGGQRQRLAIARALVLRPRLLLFDEATSALDPESEAIVQTNLAEIGRGRTMIIVSHRLSSLVKSDSILVLERGEIVDFAPHATLLERCEIYRHLWQQQTGHLQC